MSKDKFILSVERAICRAEDFANKLPHDAPRAQFILSLCDYCRGNYYFKRGNHFWNVVHYAFFVNLPLAQAKLGLAAGILCRLMGENRYFLKWYENRTEVAEGGPVFIKFGDTQVRIVQSSLQLVAMCAQDLARESTRYRETYAPVTASPGMGAIFIPVRSGKLDAVCDAALKSVREKFEPAQVLSEDGACEMHSVR
ncbi:MAG: hypothetical protein KAS93_06265 [Gammaproteobacteria bacterium]|nr:hypothetical protein [Gammaproteobacteria bacterium]